VGIESFSDFSAGFNCQSKIQLIGPNAILFLNTEFIA